jgi:hypothetical protein
MYKFYQNFMCVFKYKADVMLSLIQDALHLNLLHIKMITRTFDVSIIYGQCHLDRSGCHLGNAIWLHKMNSNS